MQSRRGASIHERQTADSALRHPPFDKLRALYQRACFNALIAEGDQGAKRPGASAALAEPMSEANAR